MQVLPVAQSWKNGQVRCRQPRSSPCRLLCPAGDDALPRSWAIGFSTWKMQTLPVALPLSLLPVAAPCRSGTASRDRPFALALTMGPFAHRPGRCRPCRLPRAGPVMQALPVALVAVAGCRALPVRCRQPRSSPCRLLCPAGDDVLPRSWAIGFSTWNMQALPVSGDALPLECRSCRLPELEEWPVPVPPAAIVPLPVALPCR